MLQDLRISNDARQYIEKLDNGITTDTISTGVEDVKSEVEKDIFRAKAEQ